MKYDDFIYEFIKLLMSWGTWKDSVKIFYKNKVYSPCQMQKAQQNKFFDFEDYERRLKIYEADVEKSIYRDLKNVIISDMTDEDKAFTDRWPERCEMFVEFNGPLNNLFEFGILETDLSDLPMSRKMEAYQERETYQEEFHEQYDEEEIRINPEEYGFPSELEFDSADEYSEFIEDEISKAEHEFISNLSGTIEYDNDLEAEICDLCIKYDLSYSFVGDGLYIGHGYF